MHAVSVPHELSPRSADAIAAAGESLSSRLVTGALAAAHHRGVWIDATQVLVTDDVHGRAQPLMDITTGRLRSIVVPVLEAGNVPVIGGYVGATENGVTTTLGRGGSDFSAAIFGAALDAEEIQIWTDVDGMLTADAHRRPGAPHTTALVQRSLRARLLRRESPAPGNNSTSGGTEHSCADLECAAPGRPRDRDQR